MSDDQGVSRRGVLAGLGALGLGSLLLQDGAFSDASMANAVSSTIAARRLLICAAVGTRFCYLLS